MRSSGFVRVSSWGRSWMSSYSMRSWSGRRNLTNKTDPDLTLLRSAVFALGFQRRDVLARDGAHGEARDLEQELEQAHDVGRDDGLAARQQGDRDLARRIRPGEDVREAEVAEGARRVGAEDADRAVAQHEAVAVAQRGEQRE